MFYKDDQIKLKDSQNFLHNKKLVFNLIEESNICKDDIVIEIGGGRGIITEQLVKKCKKLYVIEYDYNLYKGLKDIYILSFKRKRQKNMLVGPIILKVCVHYS